MRQLGLFDLSSDDVERVRDHLRRAARRRRVRPAEASLVGIVGGLLRVGPPRGRGVSALHGDALHVRELVATVVGAEPALDADHALRSVSLIEKVWPGLNFKSSFKLD